MRLATSLNCFLVFGALAGVTVVLPVVGSGCGRTACFVYTQGEYSKHGACPAQGKALANFTDPRCAGPVISVDGAGVFNLDSTTPDDSTCCYPVTQQDIEQTFGNGCGPPSGAGGAGGFSTATSSFTSTGFVSAVGVGGSTGGCSTCKQELESLGANSAPLCPQSSIPWTTLSTCICNGNSACAMPCHLNLCMSAPLSKECFNCIQDPAMTSGCTGAFTDCENN